MQTTKMLFFDRIPFIKTGSKNVLVTNKCFDETENYKVVG